jgi:large subunit ribosomal protein L34
MYVNGKSNKRKRVRKHGFRARMRDAINVLKARRLKGRHKLSVSDEKRKY